MRYRGTREAFPGLLAIDPRRITGPAAAVRQDPDSTTTPPHNEGTDMKHLLASTCIVVGFLAMTGAARAECGDLTIASMNWQSAEVLAALDKFILNEGYGRKAGATCGRTSSTGASRKAS